jgi:hypothetical protein
MKLEIYQRIYTKLFKKLELDKFLHYNITDYEYKSLKEYEFIIPFDKILTNIFTYDSLDDNFDKIHDDYIPDKHRNKLIKEVNKSLKHKKLIVNEYLYIFMNTINSWIEQYSLKAIYNLVEIFSDVMDDCVYQNIKENIYLLFDLGVFTIVNLYNRNKLENNLDEWALFLQFQSYIFEINISFIKQRYHIKLCCAGFVDIAIAKEKFKEYINYIGLDEYKIFLNNLYSYIVLMTYTQEKYKIEIVKSNLINFYKVFVIQCEYSHLLPVNQVEEVLKIFIRYNLYDKNGLNLLEEYDSSYIDEYKSFLLMKDLMKAD